MKHEQKHRNIGKKSWWLTWPGLGCTSLLAIISISLIINYPDYFNLILPWIILFLCPLIHLFMHRNHNRHKSRIKQG